MKKTAKILFTVAIMSLFFAVSGFPSYAVPAVTGSSGGDHGRCHSATAETPVTMEVLAERDRLKEQKVREKGFDEGTKVAGVTKDQTERSIPLLCVVVGFNGTTGDAPEGLPYSEEYDWGEYIFRSNDSVTRYYKDMSLGKFTFVPASESSRYGTGGNKNKQDKTNDGIIHVTVDQPHRDWSDLDTLDFTELYRLFTEAIEKAAPYVDLGNYEVDGNGVIDNNELAICFILAGYDPSVESDLLKRGAMNYVWPFAYTFHQMKDEIDGFTYPELNGIKIDRYICMAESMVVDEPEQALLSTVYHELGHYLGLPDMYNTTDIENAEWKYYDVGVMSLMARGCWGVTPDGDNVVYSLDMWSRYHLGWVDAELITESGTYTVSGDDLSAKTQNPRLYRINGVNQGEYYLIENRRLSNWDQYLNYGIAERMHQNMYSSEGGIIIWHIDENVIEENRDLNTVNSIVHRPGIMPIYPEESSVYDFCLITDSSNGSVLNDPFYISKVSALGEYSFLLPSYCGGDYGNIRSSRFEAPVKICITGSSADEMQFTVSFTSNGWFRSGSNWRYVGSDGLMVTGWQNIKDKLYYFDKMSGMMKTGWLKLGRKWYYLSDKGVMKTGWMKYKDEWYYLSANGVMKTGWLKSGGNWYYLTANGAMKTGWLKTGGKWYYLSNTGAMVTGTHKTGAKTYLFDESGVCLNP